MLFKSTFILDIKIFNKIYKLKKNDYKINFDLSNYDFSNYNNFKNNDKCRLFILIVIF